MVDVVNNIELVKPKMIEQMRYNRQIYGMDEMLSIISNTDPTFKGTVQTKNLDMFLGTLGIFLKSQEQTELCTYCGRTPENEQIYIEKFINIFKMQPPKKLINVLQKVFNQLKDGEGISLDKFWSSIKINKHPLVKIYKRNVQYTQPKFEKSVKAVLGNKNIIGFQDFVDLYMNNIYLMPVENVNYFIKYIPELYGLPVEDF